MNTEGMWNSNLKKINQRVDDINVTGSEWTSSFSVLCFIYAYHNLQIVKFQFPTAY
jgi:hypothetical protein